MTDEGSLVGREFGAWRVSALLAEGGMARVWRVVHGGTGVHAALKVSRSRDPDLLARAEREARIQGAILHPHVLAALEVVSVDDTPGLVLELVEGGLTLDRRMEGGPLVGAELDGIVAGLLAGVEAAHLAGFIHRDLKPANVLLSPTSDGALRPLLADFGLARREVEPADEKMTRAGYMLGSATYMAPEQARDAGSVDARADLWSLGVMLYEAVAGAPPFFGTDVQIVLERAARGQYPPLDSVVPDVPPRWVVAVEACLQVDPERRVPDVKTLREVLAGTRRWVGGSGGGGRSLPGVASAAAAAVSRPRVSAAPRAAETFVVESVVKPAGRPLGRVLVLVIAAIAAFGLWFWGG